MPKRDGLVDVEFRVSAAAGCSVEYALSATVEFLVSAKCNDPCHQTLLYSDENVRPSL